MTEVSTAATGAASAESPITERVRYAMANDVWASLRGGGSISVQEYPEGSIVKAAEQAGRAELAQGSDSQASSLVVSLANDVVGGAPMNVVWFHSDRLDRLAIISRARQALDDAEAALLACGYVDDADMVSA